MISFLKNIFKRKNAVCIFCNKTFDYSDFVYYYKDVGVCKKCNDCLPFVPTGKIYAGSNTNSISNHCSLSYSMSVFYYLIPVRNAILDFKFSGCFAYGEVLSHYFELLGCYLSDTISGDILHTYDLIVPVPISKERYIERGFNQSDILAKGLSDFNIPISKDALSRIKHTERQSLLKTCDRAENVRNAYLANSEIVSGKRIILIDDVLTSGSTLLECARELKSKGATDVIAFTLCRRPDSSHSDAYKELFL